MKKINNKPSGFKTMTQKQRQIALIIVVIVIGICLALAILASGHQKTPNAAHGDESGHTEDSHAEGGHAEGGHEEDQHEQDTHEQTITLTQAQLTAQQIQLARVSLGNIAKTIQLPARLMLNSDQQAHISAGFAGRVQQVHVQVGQQVQQGQPLATLVVPELIDMQSNLKVLQSQRALANSAYQREKKLWQQGISAKQDYLQAKNDDEQANTTLQAAQARLHAYGANASSAGRFVVKAPIAGVISSKDLVMGESIQTTDQLFVLDQLDQLWVEFVVPDDLADSLNSQQRLKLTVPHIEQPYYAKFMYLTPSADTQTGRYLARASVANKQLKLRPNQQVLVDIESLAASAAKSASAATTLVINTKAVQQLAQADVVFVAKPHGNNFELTPRKVQLGNKSNDQTQVEVLAGLSAGEQYVTQGSFILKSELQKGEASHEH